MNFTTWSAGLSFPEGPVALGDGSLICVEVMAGNLTHIDAGGNTAVLAKLGGGPNGAALGPDGRCYVCNNGGLSLEDIANLANPQHEAKTPDLAEGRIEVVDLVTREWKLLYAACDGEALIAPNDLVFDSHGGFYFSDFGSLRQSIPQTGYVYYALADGSKITRIDFKLQRPNGIGLSPDGSILYISETSTGRLWALDILGPGILGKSGVRFHTPLFHDSTLSMDSLAVQADGKVCVACPHNDLIVRIAPDGSAERIPTPGSGPANICFGGADNHTAHVACLHTGTILTAEWDAPGLTLNFQQPYGFSL